MRILHGTMAHKLPEVVSGSFSLSLTVGNRVRFVTQTDRFL